MDKAVSVQRRIEAMKKLHSEGIRTTCFISPIFPEITDVFSIIEAVKPYCQHIWLENLNLRGSYKADILNYIKEKYPHLVSLYHEIYHEGKRDYWEKLDVKLRLYAKEKGLNYVVNQDDREVDFDAPPTLVNFFYHEEIKKSAKALPKKKMTDLENLSFFDE